MKKTIKVISSTLATVLVASSFAACRGNRDGLGEAAINDGKTVNVLISHTGFGTSYVYKMEEAFEKIYADEGYQVNVIAPIASMGEERVYQSIYSGDGIDVFFTTFNLQLALEGKYGHTLADMSELVYNQKPIKLDGTEEDCTVASKLEGMIYDNAWGGKYYGVPYSYSIAGLCVNTVALNQLGLTIPRTSNELFECVDQAMAKFKDTNIAPFTHGGGTYLQNFVELWFAQYLGAEKMREFWSFEDSEGNPIQNPAEIFSSTYGDGVYEKVLKDYYRVCDYNTHTYGSMTQDFKDAQMQFMQGNALFYSCGDWLYQEEMERNKDKLNDIVMARIPVTSSLGTKIFGAGTSYGYNNQLCEQILREIISGVDANQALATITANVNSKLSVSLQEADVKTVCERAGYIYGRHDGTMAVISEKSQVKDIAAKFLRMITSDDGASMFAHETKVANPFNVAALADETDTFLKSSYSLIDNSYRSEYQRTASGYRLQFDFVNWTPLTGNEVQISHIFPAYLSLYDNNSYAKIKDESIFDEKVRSLVNSIYEDAKEKVENKLG